MLTFSSKLERYLPGPGARELPARTVRYTIADLEAEGYTASALAVQFLMRFYRVELTEALRPGHRFPLSDPPLVADPYAAGNERYEFIEPWERELGITLFPIAVDDTLRSSLMLANTGVVYVLSENEFGWFADTLEEALGKCIRGVPMDERVKRMGYTSDGRVVRYT